MMKGFDALTSLCKFPCNSCLLGCSIAVAPAAVSHSGAGTQEIWEDVTVCLKYKQSLLFKYHQTTAEARVGGEEGVGFSAQTDIQRT